MDQWDKESIFMVEGEDNDERMVMQEVIIYYINDYRNHISHR
jgi:hypothetical protein